MTPSHSDLGTISPRHNIGSLRNSPSNDTVSNASFIQGLKAQFSQRKQSHDIHSRPNMFSATTMGSGLKDRGVNHSVISPRDVISEARQQILINEGVQANQTLRNN